MRVLVYCGVFSAQSFPSRLLIFNGVNAKVFFKLVLWRWTVMKVLILTGSLKLNGYGVMAVTFYWIAVSYIKNIKTVTVLGLSIRIPTYRGSYSNIPQFNSTYLQRLTIAHVLVHSLIHVQKKSNYIYTRYKIKWSSKLKNLTVEHCKLIILFMMCMHYISVHIWFYTHLKT